MKENSPTHVWLSFTIIPWAVVFTVIGHWQVEWFITVAGTWSRVDIAETYQRIGRKYSILMNISTIKSRNDI